jgi:hypothetical protein
MCSEIPLNDLDCQSHQKEKFMSQGNHKEKLIPAVIGESINLVYLISKAKSSSVSAFQGSAYKLVLTAVHLLQDLPIFILPCGWYILIIGTMTLHGITTQKTLT